LKVISLLYHDVVEKNSYNESGFLSDGANIYKLDIKVFKRHLHYIHSNIKSSPIIVSELQLSKIYYEKRIPTILTFDDGGISAYTNIFPLLEQYSWKAHFFITTKFIGTNTFVSKDQIISMHNSGHIIGTHSHTHPDTISKIGISKIRDEWNKSKTILSDIIGEEIIVASIPGGYFSQDVAKVASEVGIRFLFTSEPITKPVVIDDCIVLGRFTILGEMSPAVSGNIVSSFYPNRIKQYMSWNSKKLLKILLGNKYLLLRKYIINNKNHKAPINLK